MHLQTASAVCTFLHLALRPFLLFFVPWPADLDLHFPRHLADLPAVDK